MIKVAYVFNEVPIDECNLGLQMMNLCGKIRSDKVGLSASFRFKIRLDSTSPSLHQKKFPKGVNATREKLCFAP